MSAYSWLDVFHGVLALSLSVVGPVWVVTHHPHGCIRLTLWTLCPYTKYDFDTVFNFNNRLGQVCSQDKKTGYLPAGFTVCTASVVVAKDPPVVATADPPVVASEEQDDAGSPLHAL